MPLLMPLRDACMRSEIIDAMWAPSKYDVVYPASYLFTFLIAAPHSVLVQLAFPALNLKQDNVYGALPKSTARTASIVLMLAHQIVAYALCAQRSFARLFRPCMQHINIPVDVANLTRHPSLILLVKALSTAVYSSWLLPRSLTLAGFVLFWLC